MVACLCVKSIRCIFGVDATQQLQLQLQAYGKAGRVVSLCFKGSGEDNFEDVLF